MEINSISLGDPRYPALLREISDPPKQLYYRGRLSFDSPALGVVGTRKISSYGRSVTPMLVEPLARAGVTIVSGLAYGVDALSHNSALNAGGRTIAVLGGGLDDDSLYPANHIHLAHQILDAGGLLLSEYPAGTPAYPNQFVARNRIISGLSNGVLVIEAPAKSGALHTAQFCVDEGRDLFVVPGQITDDNSSGTNDLFKHGAYLVTEADDILFRFGITPPKQQQSLLPRLSPEEKKVYSALKAGPLSVDNLATQLNLPASAVGTALTFLEMKGLVRGLGGQMFGRTK